MSPSDADRDDDQLARAGHVVGNARKVTVLTGAGVSTDSGIPDFRGPQGLWTRDPAAERLSNIDAYVSDPDVRRTVWRERLEFEHQKPQPNAAHRALVRLEAAGRLEALVTQNVDGLHAAAGTSPDKLIEIHGTAREAKCLSCHRRQPIGEVLARVETGEEDPDCHACGGLLKAATVSFGQQLDPADVGRAHEAAAACDVFLAAGTSLVVHPVAGLPAIALEAGAQLVIVNDGATPYDEQATALVGGRLGQALPALVDQAVAGG